MGFDTRADALARLDNDLETGRPDELAQFFLEYLAEWGPQYIDVQAYAERVLDHQGDEG